MEDLERGNGIGEPCLWNLKRKLEMPFEILFSEEKGTQMDSFPLGAILTRSFHTKLFGKELT